MTFPILLGIALAATQPSNLVRVRSVDAVAAFSEDGRSALISRTGLATGGGNSQAWMLISLDAPAQTIEISRVGVSGNIAVQLIDVAVCRDNARELERILADDFFGIVTIDIGGCARSGRPVVDIRKNLRIRPLKADELNALIARHGPGNFVAHPDGDIVIRLVGDFEGNVTAARPVARIEEDER